MITPNMTPGIDAQLIWLIKINLDGQTLYFSDTKDGITLSGIFYSGAALHKQSWEEASLDKSIDLSFGGNTGSVGNFTFSIVRYSGVSGVSNFFNDFYPATSQEYITARTIQLGYVWEGATLSSQITWEQKFYVYDYTYNHNVIELTCLEGSDLIDKMLPYYKVQDEYDDGISYWTNAVDEVYGKPISIVYGDFAPGEQTLNMLQQEYAGYELFRFAPGLIVNKSNLTSLYASHSCHTVGNLFGASNDYLLFRYFDGVDKYMRIKPEVAGASSGNNNLKGHYFAMKSIAPSVLLGDIAIPLILLGGKSDITDVENITDGDNNTYKEIDAGEKVSLSPEGNISGVGVLSTSETDIMTTFFISSNDAGSRDWKIAFYYEKNGSLIESTTNNTGTTTGTSIAGRYHYYGDTNKPNGTDSEPYDVNELLAREYFVENTEVTAGNKIRVYRAFIFWNNINVLSVVRKSVPSLRNYGRGRGNS